MPAQKYPKKAFLVRNLKFSFLLETLVLEKFESVTFKYANGFFKFQPKINQIKQFLS